MAAGNHPNWDDPELGPYESTTETVLVEIKRRMVELGKAEDYYERFNAIYKEYRHKNNGKYEFALREWLVELKAKEASQKGPYETRITTSELKWPPDETHTPWTDEEVRDEQMNHRPEVGF